MPRLILKEELPDLSVLDVTLPDDAFQLSNTLTFVEPLAEELFVLHRNRRHTGVLIVTACFSLAAFVYPSIETEFSNTPGQYGLWAASGIMMIALMATIVMLMRPGLSSLDRCLAHERLALVTIGVSMVAVAFATATAGRVCVERRSSLRDAERQCYADMQPFILVPIILLHTSSQPRMFVMAPTVFVAFLVLYVSYFDNQTSDDRGWHGVSPEQSVIKCILSSLIAVLLMSIAWVQEYRMRQALKKSYQLQETIALTLHRQRVLEFVLSSTLPHDVIASGANAYSTSDAKLDRGIVVVVDVASKRNRIATHSHKSSSQNSSDGLDVVVVASTSSLTETAPNEETLEMERCFRALDDAVVACGLRRIRVVGGEFFAVAHSVEQAKAVMDFGQRAMGSKHRVDVRMGVHVGMFAAAAVGAHYYLYGPAMRGARALKDAALPGTALSSLEFCQLLDVDPGRSDRVSTGVGVTGVRLEVMRHRPHGVALPRTGLSVTALQRSLRQVLANVDATAMNSSLMSVDQWVQNVTDVMSASFTTNPELENTRLDRSLQIIPAALTSDSAEASLVGSPRSSSPRRHHLHSGCDSSLPGPDSASSRTKSAPENPLVGTPQSSKQNAPSTGSNSSGNTSEQSKMVPIADYTSKLRDARPPVKSHSSGVRVGSESSTAEDSNEVTSSSLATSNNQPADLDGRETVISYIDEMQVARRLEKLLQRGVPKGESKCCQSELLEVMYVDKATNDLYHNEYVVAKMAVLNFVARMGFAGFLLVAVLTSGIEECFTAETRVLLPVTAGVSVLSVVLLRLQLKLPWAAEVLLGWIAVGGLLAAFSFHDAAGENCVALANTTTLWILMCVFMGNAFANIRMIVSIANQLILIGVFLSFYFMNASIFPSTLMVMFVLTIQVITWRRGIDSTLADEFEAHFTSSTIVKHLGREERRMERVLKYLAPAWALESLKADVNAARSMQGAPLTRRYPIATVLAIRAVLAELPPTVGFHHLEGGSLADTEDQQRTAAEENLLEDVGRLQLVMEQVEENVRHYARDFEAVGRQGDEILYICPGLSEVSLRSLEELFVSGSLLECAAVVSAGQAEVSVLRNEHLVSCAHGPAVERAKHALGKLSRAEHYADPAVATMLNVPAPSMQPTNSDVTGVELGSSGEMLQLQWPGTSRGGRSTIADEMFWSHGEAPFGPPGTSPRL